MSKISSLRALNSFFMHTCTREKPVKPSFSVRVENMPYNCSVCQNTADLHLIQWLVIPFESSLILPHSYPPIQYPENLTEHQCEGLFL